MSRQPSNEIERHEESAAESRRVARELHDRVAHEVSVMQVQAQAATAVLHHDRDRAELALAAIAATGRELLIEIRRLLVVGPSDEATARVPQSRRGPAEGSR